MDTRKDANQEIYNQKLIVLIERYMLHVYVLLKEARCLFAETVIRLCGTEYAFTILGTEGIHFGMVAHIIL